MKKLEKRKEIDEKDPELNPHNPVNLECRWVWAPPIGQQQAGAALKRL